MERFGDGFLTLLVEASVDGDDWVTVPGTGETNTVVGASTET